MIFHENLYYATAEGHKLVMDLFLPECDRPTPVIVHIHGGWWAGGDHKAHLYLEKYMEKGFALADIAYRLTSDAPFPAQIIDCHTAVRFLRANADQYNLNPDKIGVFGFSAGGHLSALLGTTANVAEFTQQGEWQGYSSEVQAVVCANGPHDVPFGYNYTHAQSDNLVYMLGNAFPKEEVERINAATYGVGCKAYNMLTGGDDSVLQKASVLHYVHADMPPYLIITGEVDTGIPILHATRLYDAMRAVGAKAELLINENTWHSMMPGDTPAVDAAVERLVGFLGEELGR